MGKKKKVYWETKDGKKINIDDMDIEYLRNTLKMIVRKNKKNKFYIEPYAFDYNWK